MTFSDVLDKLDFAELVSTKVKLIPSGRNKFKGLSPFTSEKTPSFYIDNEAKTWYCFSSNAGGGVLDYVTKTEGLDRGGAIRFLKDYLGIEDEEDQNSIESRLRRLMFVASAYFSGYNEMAVEYLKNNRGIAAQEAQKLVETYDLGYCPNQDHEEITLYMYLIDNGVSEDAIQESGLFFESGSRSCRYGERVTIPIKNEYGQVVSFTGRDTRPPEPRRPKYMHGKNSILFNKSNIVWNLSNVRNLVSEQDKVIVCEGQLDAIAVTETGTPAVAVLGSRVSNSQLRTLSRITNNLYMVFDSDDSGQKGLLSAFKLISELDIDAVFYSVVLPKGKDPDEFIKENGSESFREIIENAVPDTAHVVQALLKDKLSAPNATKATVARKVLAELKPYLKKSYTYRSLDLMERLSQELGLNRRDLQDWVSKGTSFGHGKSTINKIEEIQFPAPVYERRILYSIMKDTTLLFKVQDKGLSIHDMESHLVSKVLSLIKPNMSTNEVIDELSKGLTSEEYQLVVSFFTQGLLEADFDTSLSILMAKVTLRSKKATTDFLGRPLSSVEVEFKRVIGDVIKYNKEPF